MTIEDLEHIFRKQIELDNTKLNFMLCDQNRTQVLRLRCSLDELTDMLPMFDSFVYDGERAGIPRFCK